MSADRALVIVSGSSPGSGGLRSLAGPVARIAAGFGLKTLLLSRDDQPPAAASRAGCQHSSVTSCHLDQLAAAMAAVESRPVAVLADGPKAALAAAQLAAKLGVRGPDPDAVAGCLDHGALRWRLAEAGIPLAAADPGPGRLVAAVDGAVVGFLESVGPADGRDCDCPGTLGRREQRSLRDLALRALGTLGLVTGPALVRIAGAGHSAGVIDVLPSGLDAIQASLVQLATGVDPLVLLVAPAAGVAPVASDRAASRGGRRFASVRFGRSGAAGLAVPGIVTVRTGPEGHVVAVAERPAVAATAAASALAITDGAGAPVGSAPANATRHREQPPVEAAAPAPASPPGDGRLRLACVRGDDYHHRYLESLLRSRYDVRLVVVEPESEKVSALRSRGKYRDYGYHLYHHYRRQFTFKDRYRREYFSHTPRLWQLRPEHTMRVGSVNSDEVVAALGAADVDLVVIIGCSVLRERTLEAAGPLIVNVHGGFLPYYRGNHCFFFAVYDRRFDRVGSTIHRVDTGVDTGNLIEVVRPPLTADDLPEHLYCRADLLAIHRLLDWLDLVEAGGTLPSLPQPPLGRTYRTRDRGPLHDLRYFARRCARRLGWRAQGSQSKSSVQGGRR